MRAPIDRGRGRVAPGLLLLFPGPLSRPTCFLRFADAPACFRTHGSLTSLWLAVVLNARIVNGVLTPRGWSAAPNLEPSLYRGQAVDFGLQADQGVGGEIVLGALSWHSGRAYQHSPYFETVEQCRRVRQMLTNSRTPNEAPANESDANDR
jgi:hypothetical protein